MPATKTELIGGVFQDSEGNVLANGYLKMRLSSDEVVTGVGQIAAGIVVTITLNSSGSVDTSTPQLVWANDVMTPANNYYIVEGFTAAGQLAWGPNNQQVTSGGVGGGTFDTGTWIPNTVLSWFYPTSFGPTGPTGPSASGTTGPTGPAGATGATGAAGATGTFSGVGPRPGTANWRLWSSSGSNSATFGSESVGCVPGSQANTYAAVAPTTTQPTMVQLNCATTAGGSQVIFGDNRGGTQQRNYTLGLLTVVQVKAALSSLSSARLWIAANDKANNSEAVFASNNPAANVAGFRYSSTVPDTNWIAYCSTDASNFTAADTGVAADTNPHVFQIESLSSGTQVRFSIDGVVVATISTHVPSASQVVGTTISCDNVNTTNALGVTLAYSYLETNS